MLKRFSLILMALILATGLIGYTPEISAQASGDTEDYTYKLTQSTAAYQFWTTPPSERVFKDSVLPTDSGAEVKVYAAKNEFEPFQVVVKPTATGNVTVSIDALGAGITAELYQVKYVNIAQKTDSLGRTGPYPDPLWPLANGATAALTAGKNTAFWFSLSVPATAAFGDYTTAVHIGGVSIPVRLHVFNFAIPNALHVASQMNFSHETVLNKYGVTGTGANYWMYVDKMKQYFIDHRLTPSSVLWSGGLTSGGTFAQPYIGYNCATHAFTDSDGIWGFESPAARYVGGTGLMSGTFTQPFNGGTGFSTFMAAGFAHNDPSQDQRPTPFCGQTRSASDWLQNPTSAYNTAWFAYVTAMQNYLNSKGYLDEAYHYIANEPQDQADYNAVAWYSRYSHAAAPNLKLMVSEGAKPEIYGQTGARVDIWLPVLNEYNPVTAQAREKNNGEETWVYFLHGTRPPYFNPITLDHPGIESKLTGWFLWKYRIRGIAYYALNDWGQNPWTTPMTDGHNGDTFMLYPPAANNQPITYGANGHRFVPSIRFELMRDSLEDYEYLHTLSGGRPEVDVANAADPQVNKIIAGLTGYTRSSEFMYNLRRLIGLKNGGEIATIPDITPPVGHPRSEGEPGYYYINFQDPAGQPTANPLVVNGKTYMKIGSNDYNQSLGYGWFAPNDVNWMTQWLDSGPNVLQRSILYSDWGRKATLEFDLPNGEYNVTVSVGWQGRTYSKNKVNIEGVNFVNSEASNPYIVRTKTIYVNDYKITLEIGDGAEYTMLNYLDIEATVPPAINTSITVKPPAATNSTSAKFEFSSNKPNSTFECALDSAAFSACASPQSYSSLSLGAHQFKVRATDNEGNTDDTPAAYIWSIKETLHARFISSGGQDGWVLESTETSSKGGSMSATQTVLILGDNNLDRQYRSILSFNTAGLPDNVTVTAARLKIRSQAVSGVNPFTTHGALLVDIRRGSFGNNPVLQISDFENAASQNSVASFPNTPVSSWYTAGIKAVGLQSIHPASVTQFRLRFQLDDNNDNGKDVIQFFSGNYANASLRPALEIDYFVP